MPTPFRCVAFHDTLLRTEKPPYRFPHTAAECLFAEQVAVCAGAGQRQHQNIIFYAVDKQPVRENVTFPMACPIELLEQVVALLAMGEPLPDKNRDHDLSGDWAGHRECHILPDWLLVYRIEDDVLVLTLARTATHSDLFGK